MRHRQRNSKNCVRAQVLFIGGAIEGDHRMIDPDLVQGVHAYDSVGDLAFDIIDRFQNAFSKILVFLPIAKFPCFMFPGASPARNDCAANCAAS